MTEPISGHVDEISLKQISGWARVPDSRGSEVVVIRIQDRSFEVAADQPRPDLSEAGLGNCAFRFEIPMDLAGRSEVEIEVKLKSTGRTLPKGFRIFRNGIPRETALKEWAERSCFGDAYTWIKDSSLDDLNFRLHEHSGASGNAALRARARAFVEFFRADPEVAAKLFTAPAAPASVKPAEVLDFGPGTGWPMQYVLESFHARVTGLDVSENMLARLKERMSEELAPGRRDSFSLVHYDGNRFPVPDDRFDLAMGFACLHHIPEEWLYLYFQEFHRALKSGGVVIGQVLDSTRSYRDKAEIDRELARRRRRDFEMHPHFYHSREGIGALLGHAGFRDVRFLDGTEAVHYYVGFIARK